jgi:hypothetical protein
MLARYSMHPRPRRQRCSPLPSVFFCRLRSLIIASPSTPRLSPLDRSKPPPRRPRLPPARKLLPFPPACRIEHPLRHLPDALVIPPPHASVHGRKFVGSPQCQRRLPGVLPRVGKLEWRVAGVDSTLAASKGAPTPLKDGGERGWWKGMHRFGEAEGRVGGKWDRWVAGVPVRFVTRDRGVHQDQPKIVACRRGPPTPVRVFAPPQDGP